MPDEPQMLFTFGRGGASSSGAMFGATQSGVWGMSETSPEHASVLISEAAQRKYLYGVLAWAEGLMRCDI